MIGRRTDMLDVVSRKLAPFVMLFGFYLITFGHATPGGGFQGGVVIASGVILLALGRGSKTTERRFPVDAVHLAEAIALSGLLAVGATGLFLTGSFLGNFVKIGTSGEIYPIGFIFILNVLFGVKVGAGISVICLKLFEENL